MRFRDEIFPMYEIYTMDLLSCMPHGLLMCVNVQMCVTSNYRRNIGCYIYFSIYELMYVVRVCLLRQRHLKIPLILLLDFWRAMNDFLCKFLDCLHTQTQTHTHSHTMTMTMTTWCAVLYIC